jgi:hypothetical protein
VHDVQFSGLRVLAHYATLHPMTLDEYFARPDARPPAEVALAAEISESTLSRIRRGLQNTTRDVIVRLVDATGGLCSADDIVFPLGRLSNDEAGFGSATNHTTSICSSETEGTRANNPPEIIRDVAASEGGRGVPFPPNGPSDRPSSALPSTCSTIPASTASCASPASSTGKAEAA